MGGADPIHKPVGIEAWAGHHGQNGSGIRIHRNHRTPVAFPLQGSRRCLLDPQAQMGDQPVSGQWSPAAQSADLETGGVDVLDLVTYGAPELPFIKAFEARFANVVAAEIASGLKIPEIGGRNGADISHDVGEQGLIGVVAVQDGNYPYTRQLPGPYGNGGHLRLAEVCLQYCRIKSGPASQPAVKTLEVPVIQPDQFLQPIQGGREVVHLIWRNFDIEGGAVFCQNFPVVGYDVPPGRGDRDQGYMVVVGQCPELFVMQHIQVNQSGQQGQQHDHDKQAGRPETATERAGLLERGLG